MKKNNIYKHIFLFRLLLIFILLFAEISSNNAQTIKQGTFWDLGEEVTSGNQAYEASYYINLKQGFKQTSPLFFSASINEGVVGPHPYQPEVSGESRPLNKNFPVGSLPGSFDVSSSGSATYSVSIETPPGTAGMEPDLSINYSSSAGSGLLGMGFDLSGLSSISRTGKDVFHDGIITGVKFNENDRFSLDGERLLKLNGTYGLAGSEYRPESEYYTKVLLNSNLSNQLYFEVWTKDGLIKEYGYTDDSRIERNGETDQGVYTWQLNKVKDYYGNYIEYKYHKDKINGEYYIESILYTGNEKTGLLPYNEIKFFYDESDDKNVVYDAGSHFTKRLLLRKIKTFCEGKLVKIYQFKYAKNFYSHLNEIILAAGDGTRLNSTVINWGTHTNPVTTVFDGGCHGNVSCDLEKYRDNPNYFVDVNGDGNKELLVFPLSEICDPNHPLYLNWELYKYDLNSNDKHLIEINSGCFNTPNSINPLNDTINRNNFLKVQPVDLDLDGKEELMFITSVSTGGDEFKVFCRTFKFNENNELVKFENTAFPDFEFYSLIVPTYHSLAYNKPFYNNLIDYSLHVGDFNGDGFVDLLFRSASLWDWSLKTFVKNNGQWSFQTLGTWNLLYLNELMREDYINSGDFDGDGKTELLWEDKIVKFNTSNGTTNYTWSRSDALHTLLYAPSHHDYIGGADNKLLEAKTGDFNGDGITDIIFNFETYYFQHFGQYSHNYSDYHNFYYHWHIAYGIGDVAEVTEFYVPDNIDYFKNDWSYTYQYYIEHNVEEGYHHTGYRGINHRLYVADLNNDGKSDITDGVFIINKQQNSSKEEVQCPITHSWIGKILLSKGIGFDNINPLSEDYSINLSHILFKNQTLIGEHPKEYYVFNDFTGKGNLQIFDGLKSYDICPNLSEQKVVSICDGYNSITKIGYSTLMNPDVYTMGSGSTYPLIDKGAPVCVVSNVNVDNGKTEGMNIGYTYEGLKVHVRGKGSLGFFKNTITNLLTQKQTINTYEVVDNTFYDKALKNCIIKQANTNQIFSEDIMTNIVQSYPLDGWYVRYNFPNQVVSKNYLTNAMVTSQCSYDVNMNPTHSSSAAKQIGAANDEWYSSSIYGPYTIINNSNYWVPGLLTNISSTTQKGNDPPVSHTTGFTYYDNGKLWTVVNEPNEINKTTSTYIYDPDFGNLIRNEVSGKSNISGNQETRWMNIEYEELKGRFITKITNSKGHYASFTFDPCFGNILTTTDANSNLSKYTYDIFGRPKTVTSPDNNVVTATVDWANGLGSDVLYKVKIEMPGVAPAVSYYDRIQRPVKLESRGFNNEILYKDYTYDVYGFRDKESLPYFSQNNGTAQWVNFNYDPLTNRLLTVQGPTVNVSYAYDQNKTTFTDNIMGVSQWILTDAAGNITQSHDNGGTINFAYNSQGLIKSISDPANNISYMSYDIFGNQTSLTDPDVGMTSYTYDAFGQMITQTDARGASTQMFYDELGRLLERKESMNGLANIKSTIFTYDIKPHGIGMLSSATNSDGYSEEYNYDNYSRPINSKTVIDGAEYIKSIVYDKIGRVKQYNYPSGFGIKYNYNPGTGDLVSMMRTDNDQTVWQCAEVNALGQIEKYVMGNGLITRKTYDQETHMLTGIKTGTNESNWNVQNLAYIYNNKLQLHKRQDNRSGFMLSESFTYDDLNRLTSSQVVGNDPINVTYDLNGNITGKTDVGLYSYGLPKPHALNKIQPNEGVNIPENEQNITYNESGKVKSITEGVNQLYYTYGAGQQRIKSELFVNNSLVKRKYYVGNYEKEIANGVTRELHYISAPSGLVGIMERKNGENNMYYVHSDMLGSYNSITDENGNIVEEMNFDAWGKRRNPTDWSYNDVATSFLFDRGYTGHEMLDEFGLINMNGRVYDPTNARFLSPDPIVHDPLNTQCYNRYSYCFNNPMMFTDPSGYDGENQQAHHILNEVQIVAKRIVHNKKGGYIDVDNGNIGDEDIIAANERNEIKMKEREERQKIAHNKAKETVRQRNGSKSDREMMENNSTSRVAYDTDGSGYIPGEPGGDPAKKATFGNKAGGPMKFYNPKEKKYNNELFQDNDLVPYRKTFQAFQDASNAYKPLLKCASVCLEISAYAAFGSIGVCSVSAGTSVEVSEGIVGGVSKEGVYNLLTSEGRYIGQSKDVLNRVLNHFSTGGKLSATELEESIYYSMNGSTKLEREVYEQYLINKYNINNLINIRNPMGGRMDLFKSMIDGVIKKFNLLK